MEDPWFNADLPRYMKNLAAKSKFSGLLTRTKEIDAFLGKPSSAIQKLEIMVSETHEFPLRQNLIFNLMNLTTDVTTFSTELINYISQDKDLAELVVEKASLHARLPKSRITATQLQQSIHRLGFGLVHNVVQDKIAKQVTKIYFDQPDETVRTLIKKSLRLSYIAKDLAKMVQLPQTTLVFFAGLYDYLGQIVACMRDPKAYKEVIEMSEKGSDIGSSSLVVLGFTFAELGAKMLQKLDLNEDLIDLVKNQSNPILVKYTNKKIAILIKFAEYINDTLADKSATPLSTWDKAKEFCNELDFEIELDAWVETVKLIYIEMLEAEHRLFQR